MKKALILFLTLIMLLEGCACFAETAAEPQAAVGYEAGAEEAEIAEEAADEADEAVEEAAEEAEEAAEATDEAAEEAEEEKLPPVEYNYDELTVGSTTPFDGKFFTQLWGNDSSDLDVRMLIHGYDTIEWSVEQSQFGVDPSVVSGIAVAENAAGDRTYTLTLYDDLYYSDGTKITAWDYAFSVLLSIDPKLAELGANPRPMDYLAGYNEYVSGQASYLSGLHVQDDNTLVFLVLSDHLPYFYELTMLDCVPYPIHVIAPGCEVRDDGQGVYIANADDSVEEPVFTTELLRQTIMDEATGYMSHPSVVSGPYKLTSFDGTTAEFEINEYYKGNANGMKPVIPKLIYRTADSATMMEELGRGEYGLLNRCVSTDAVQHDFDVSPIGFARGEIPYTGLYAFPADEGLRANAVAAVREAAPQSKVLEGRVCSGDQFVATRAQCEAITQTFGGLCAEMEGGAIAQVCHLNQTPYVIIRAISDDSDDMTFEQFQAEAARECASAVIAMVTRL